MTNKIPLTKNFGFKKRLLLTSVKRKKKTKKDYINSLKKINPNVIIRSVKIGKQYAIYTGTKKKGRKK